MILSVVFQLPLGDLSAPISYRELASELNIDLGQRASLAATRSAVLKLRTSKGMVLSDTDPDTWSVGSFFINPVVEHVPDGAPTWESANGGTKVSAAWLIEQAGFAKGFGLNSRVTISTKHALAITNRGDGTAADVLELSQHIQQGVLEKFDIQLELEPQVIS